MLKNCVCYCYHGNDSLYYKLLKLSLHSLNKFFNKSDIFVHSEVDLPELHDLCNIVIVKFPDGFCTPMAYRLVLTEKLLQSYDNVLYLDIDTIIYNNLDETFLQVRDNEISFATENQKNPDKIVNSYWAGPVLTEDEIKKYSQINSICSGVFLLNKTCSKIILDIYDYIIDLENNGFRGVCREQHGFNSYILKHNCYNYSLQNYVSHDAKNLVKNNLLTLSTAVYHFAGGVTPHDKYDLMYKLYNSIEG
jgi:lipopolysaccharide biosynthesis glycosyltransferase